MRHRACDLVRCKMSCRRLREMRSTGTLKRRAAGRESRCGFRTSLPLPQIYTCYMNDSNCNLYDLTFGEEAVWSHQAYAMSEALWDLGPSAGQGYIVAPSGVKEAGRGVAGARYPSCRQTGTFIAKVLQIQCLSFPPGEAAQSYRYVIWHRSMVAIDASVAERCNMGRAYQHRSSSTEEPLVSWFLNVWSLVCDHPTAGFQDIDDWRSPASRYDSMRINSHMLNRPPETTTRCEQQAAGSDYGAHCLSPQG